MESTPPPPPPPSQHMIYLQNYVHNDDSERSSFCLQDSIFGCSRLRMLTADKTGRRKQPQDRYSVRCLQMQRIQQIE